jgi:NADPH:quinone reductase-like Zn-dependent oxidoreductase
MQAIQLKQPGGLDNLLLAEIAARDPAAGEIRVRIHASSLNFHDYAVAVGLISVDQNRIPMSDGAGVVEAVGEGVSQFAVGDKVMSAFFPTGKMARRNWNASSACPAIWLTDSRRRR